MRSTGLKMSSGLCTRRNPRWPSTPTLVGYCERSGAGRATNVFVRSAHGWRLAHEHLSSLPTVSPNNRNNQ
ncbi:nuclear transport factor 2 family protein [Scrofimicrobium canadense]|uniref:nuclear transport factor 2 family protein n=1 Tax=Scrofimicrobium canadense TaxID=2652290 RepID=UPI0038507E2C